MVNANTNIELARGRLNNLVKFLQEFHRLRNPVVRDVRSYSGGFSFWFDELPEHDTVERGWELEDADYLLRITRPITEGCPTPPSQLLPWLLPGWENPNHMVEFRDSIEIPSSATDEDNGILYFDDQVVEFQSDFDQWKLERTLWRQREIPVRVVDKVYQDLYRLHGQLEAERERLDLQVGDALLRWNTEGTVTNHPLIMQAAELNFEPTLARITITLSTERQPELHSSLLRLFSEINGPVLASVTSAFSSSDVSVFGLDETDTFCRSTSASIHPRGQFHTDSGSPPPAGEPSISRRQVLFVRPRTFGYAVALEAIEHSLEDLDEFPASLLSLMGIEEGRDEIGALPEGYLAHHDTELLFTKAANTEQARIVKRLERDDAVLVQGPPGTGKTHTIANLIGHLLANGKKILVTSHTAKALERVREEIVDELQPLAVSAASSDAVSRSQLENSVSTITDRLSNSSSDSLRVAAKESERKRVHILKDIDRVRTKLRDSIRSEYADITVLGSSIDPATAAREIGEGIGQLDWIPGPIKSTAELPLTIEQVNSLYASNADISTDDERQLDKGLPELSSLPTPDSFHEIIDNIHRTKQAIDGTQSSSIFECNSIAIYPKLIRLRDTIDQSDELPIKLSAWEHQLSEVILRGGGYSVVWTEMLELLDEIIREDDIAAPLIARWSPKISARNQEELSKRLLQIKRHFDNGGSWNLMVRLRHPAWVGALKACQVANNDPYSAEAIAAILAQINLQSKRESLVARWNRIVGQVDGPRLSELELEPERTASRYATGLRRISKWLADEIPDIQAQVEALGLFPPNSTQTKLFASSDYDQLRELVAVKLPVIIVAAIRQCNLLSYEQQLSSLDRSLTGHCTGLNSDDAVPSIRRAVKEKDSQAYQEAYERIIGLAALFQSRRDRTSYLSQLGRAAPGWADSLNRRVGLHGFSTPPGDVENAWRWAVLNAVLNETDSTSLEELMIDLNKLEDSLRVVTSKLVSELAWASQLEQTSLSQRLALTGWVQAMRRIGRGTGKRARGLMDAARKLMSDSRTAVPVWIMPISRVVESFDFSEPQFDVVILDEASQSDIMAMTVLFLAKQVVIVGDDQQVSPTSIGQRVNQEQALIEQYLSDIPNRQLYDGRASIYDFGQQAFGGLVQLREHFRCVPEIISFSNSLSYNGNIVPLREAVGVTRQPHVVEYKVAGTRKGDKNKEEADFIVSAILSACELDEYADATFGVISLLGDKQGRLIDDQLRDLMDPEEFARRRILVGRPAQFQGDERDVIFLSLVDSSTNGPLTLQSSDDPKKRMNVAASRARDQMWVVHSLDTGTDLKADDLRLRLIQHARNPNSQENKSAAIRQKTRSELENRVADDLNRRGYKIEADYSVGAYFIDFVVFGADNRRIAIECDGDEYHTEENLNEDMARQALLERMGWTFIRLRGTDYFRYPEMVMERVYRRLGEYGIEPNTTDEKESVYQDSEVKERLLAGAARIRNGWAQKQPDETEDDSALEESRAYQPIQSQSHLATDDIDSFTTPSTVEFDDHLTAISSTQEAQEKPLTEIETNFKIGERNPLPETEVINGPPEPPGIIDQPSSQPKDGIVGSRSDYEADETDKLTRSPGSELAPYVDSATVTNDMTVASHPADEDALVLQMMIGTVIEVEGPVHEDVIADRIRTAYGLGRLRGQTRSRVMSVIREFSDGNRFLRSGSFLFLAGQENWGSDRLPRVRASRAIDHIYESELSAASLRIAMASRITDPERLLRAVANAFGFVRITGLLRDRLGEIIRIVLKRIETDAERASLRNHHSPAVSENLLVRQGYDPILEPSDRWLFFRNEFIPLYTKPVAMSTLTALIAHFSKETGPDSEIVKQMNMDLQQLRRYVGG